MADYFEDCGKVPPPDITLVSWLPFYHDMGLLLGISGSVILRTPRGVDEPVRVSAEACPVHADAGQQYPGRFSAVPNFAFELAVRRTSDDDMAGLDLGHVHSRPHR